MTLRNSRKASALQKLAFICRPGCGHDQGCSGILPGLRLDDGVFVQHRASVRVRGIGAGLALGWLGLWSARGVGTDARRALLLRRVRHGAPGLRPRRQPQRRAGHRLDHGHRRRGPTLRIPSSCRSAPGRPPHFNSDDLEGGNPAKGLPRAASAKASGDWRLELDSELDLEVLAYLRTSDGVPDGDARRRAARRRASQDPRVQPRRQPQPDQPAAADQPGRRCCGREDRRRRRRGRGRRGGRRPCPSGPRPRSRRRSEEWSAWASATASASGSS